MDANSSFQEDTVRMIIPGDAGGPIGVLFEEHAAIYFLHREDLRFSEWLVAIQESKKNSTRVRFAYDDQGQRLTFVELVK